MARDERGWRGLRHAQPALGHGEVGQHRVRAADPARSAPTRSCVSPPRWACGAAPMSDSRPTPLLAVDSAVLGSNEANTLEMASAYGTLATGGQRVTPCRWNPSSAPTARSCGRPRPQPTAGGRSAGRRRRRTTSCRTSCCTGRARPPTSDARRSARPAPTTTTTTRGSSARSRSCLRRCGSGSTRDRSRWSPRARGSRSSAARGPPRSGAS